jgi:hypothetical protein
LEWEARPLKKRPARALSAAEAAGGAWTLRDVGSTNGTRHNGEDVVREGAAHDLEDGDVVWLGRHTVAVVQVRREEGGEERRVVSYAVSPPRPPLSHPPFSTLPSQIPTPIRHALTVAETADAEAARLIKHAHAVADAAVAGLHEEVAGLAKAPAGGLCVAVGKATAA